MIFVIDIGNTNIVCAIFSNDEMITKFRISTDEKKTVDEYGILISAILDNHNINKKHIKDVVISSVVPGIIFSMQRLSEKYFDINPIILGQDYEIPVEVINCRKNEVGDDRLLNTLAINQEYKCRAVVVDFGTATTFDVINDQGQYEGSLIAPGIKLSIKALQMAAARLPSVAINKPKNVVGNTTTESMQSGIFWGYIGLVEGIIDKIFTEKKQQYKIIATGGLSTVLAPSTKIFDKIDPDLTLKGLNHCYNYIMENK